MHLWHTLADTAPISSQQEGKWWRKKQHSFCSHFYSVPISGLIRNSLRTRGSLIRHFENKAQNVAFIVSALVLRWRRIWWNQIFMCSIELQKGGGRRDRKASILLSGLQALAPTQTDYKLNIWAQKGRVCVCICVENRGKRKQSVVQGKQEGFTSTGAAFVCEAQGDDMEEGGGHYQGALSLRVMMALLFTSRFLASGAGLISQAERRSWSRLVWPGTWADEIILQRINLLPPLCQPSTRLHHLPRSRFTHLVVSRDFAVCRFQISSKKKKERLLRGPDRAVTSLSSQLSFHL